MYPPVGLGFSPGVASAAAAGVRVTRQPYPAGPQGIALSLDTVAAKIREGRLDPRIRKRAIDVLIAKGIDGRTHPPVREQVQALLDDLRASTIYIPDPVDSEHITGAATTLCLSPGECVRGEDCESLCVALASETMAIGIPTRVVKQTFGSGAQEHLIVEVQDERGVWLDADPSDKSMPVGQSHRESSRVSVDPMNPGPTTMGIARGAELVTLGATPIDRRMERMRERLSDKGCPVCRNYAWHGAYQQPVRGHHPSCSTLGGYPGPVIDLAWDARSGSFRRRGLGDAAPPVPPGPYAQAQADLNAISLSVQAADTYLATGTSGYAQALQAYQASGQTGATTVGPEIDLAGAPNVTQPITQAAWKLNALLQGTTDPLSAQTLVKNMVSFYATAIAAGQQALAGQAPPVPGPGGQSPPSGVGGPGGVSTASAVLGVLGAGLLAGLAYVAIQKQRRPMSNPTPTTSEPRAMYLLRGVDGDVVRLSYREFVKDNGELDPEELRAIKALRPGQTYRGGGGASPVWSIQRISGEGPSAFFAHASKGGQFSYPGGALGRRMHRAGRCPHCRRGARECACGRR